MNDDNTFRLMLLIVGVTFIPIAAFYRVRSFTNEKLDRWQEGYLILFGLRLTGVFTFLGVLAWMIHPNWMAWSSLPIPVWARWGGILFLVLAGILLVYTFHNLGRNLTDTVVTRRDHSLVISGPYRFVRHPFYVSCAMGMIGTSLAMANWYFLVAFAIGLSFLHTRTRIEEAKLVERFGDEYRSYMQRVGRFVPRFGHKL